MGIKAFHFRMKNGHFEANRAVFSDLFCAYYHCKNLAKASNSLSSKFLPSTCIPIGKPSEL